jgi:hypothetical protein
MILLDEWVKLAKVNELAVVDSFDDKAQLWNPSQNRRIEDPSASRVHHRVPRVDRKSEIGASILNNGIDARHRST